MNLYIRILRYVKPYWLELLGSIICMIFVSVANVATIPIIGKLSEAIGEKNFAHLNLVVAVAIAVYFIKGLFMYGQVYLSYFAGLGILKDLRIQLYRHIQDLSLDFFSKWHTGEITSRVLSDISVMQGATVASVTEILPNILTLVGVFGYLIYLNWTLTFLSLIMIPVIVYTTVRFGKEIREVSTESQRKTADIVSILTEKLSGIRIVKSFTMERHEADRFAKETTNSFWISLKEAAINATQTPLLAFIQALSIVAIIWYGGYEVVSGSLAASNLIAFFTGIALLADPISKLGNFNATVQKALAAAERVFEVIDMRPTVKEKQNPLKLDHMRGAVEFRNVSFLYEKNEEMALKDVSVKVTPGEIIALVGPSGAGKTTFVNLIPRFYDPEKGSIFVDGADLRDCELFSLRKQMGIVPQETTLFSGTIKENIAYGKIDAPEEAVISAAKMANAHEFILALPQGYGTLVGEKGVRLSGGQRQRIAIARALLRDPRILILDEATSSLDTESERLVQDALEKLMKGRTTFVIAHRLSTVQIADRILVLKDGRIEEEGSHEQLLNKGGLYRRLYEMQFRNSHPGTEVNP